MCLRVCGLRGAMDFEEQHNAELLQKVTIYAESGVNASLHFLAPRFLFRSHFLQINPTKNNLSAAALTSECWYHQAVR